MPAEPGPLLGVPGPPRWSIRLDGVFSRLVVLAGPDEQGRRALASFVIDGLFPDSAFEELIDPRLLGGVGLEIRFFDSLALPIVVDETLVLDTTGHAGIFSLRSPTGDLLGSGSVHPVPRALLRAREVEAGEAWAALLFVLLIALLFDWKRLIDRPAGFALALAALAAGRIALLATRAPAVLLPRELGSATLFGSSELSLIHI